MVNAPPAIVIGKAAGDAINLRVQWEWVATSVACLKEAYCDARLVRKCSRAVVELSACAKCACNWSLRSIACVMNADVFVDEMCSILIGLLSINTVQFFGANIR
jgi:hypothetical protein